MDPITSYLETFEALRRRKRWSLDTTILRFAAMALGASDDAEPAARLESAARELRRGAGWFGPLNSPVRYVVAAMILRQRLSATEVHRQVRRTREALRKRRLPRGGLPTTLSALLLVLRENGGPVPVGVLDRMESIMFRWKQDHRWLTGADDLPAAALHAAGEESVETVSVRVERAYQRLRRAGFRRGNALQLVSQLLAFDPRGVDAAVARFQRVVEGLREHRLRVPESHYDEAAILTLTADPPAVVVKRAISFRDRLRKARPRPATAIAFSLAAGLVLTHDARRREKVRGASDLTHLRAVQAVIAAQQAAMAAAVVASTAAASSSASSC